MPKIQYFEQKRGDGLEVGVGTGRFTVPLGVREGIEPSGAMARLAARAGG